MTLSPYMSAVLDSQAAEEEGVDEADLRRIADNISFAENTSSDPSLKKAKFARKHRFQCTFCFGKACTKEQWQKCKGTSLHSASAV